MKMILKCLLLEDDSNQLTTLKNMLLEHEVTVESFTDAEKLFLFSAEHYHRFDAVFLDIVMDGQRMNGMDTALRLRESGFCGKIVFLTSSNDFASESYAVKALSYLLKPIQRDVLAEVVRDIYIWKQSYLEAEKEAILVTCKNMVRRVRLADLVYIEVIRHTLFFHLGSGEIITSRESLKKYAEYLLEKENFASCHRSFLVNLDYVEVIRNARVYLEGGEDIPLAKGNNSFPKKFICYHSKGGRI